LSTPTVTVLLAVFNGAPLLRESIGSILAQTFADFELLVVDDGSTDETGKILNETKDARLRVLKNERNLGLTRSLNRGLVEARGEFVARQDADDFSMPSRLEKQVAFLCRHPDVPLLGTCAWRTDPEGRVTGPNDLPATQEAIRWASVTDNPFLHTSVMFRREVVLGEFGGYDERYAICQDFELWNRIAARHPVANLRARLVRMREHASSMTRTQSAETTSEMERIFAVNWADIFPQRPLSKAECELLTNYRLRFEASRLPAMRKLLDGLLSKYLSLHPAARNSADFHATLCRQSLRLGYKFLRTAPASSLNDIARAFFHSPTEWLAQAGAALWARYR
jgi:glycosyltransferase involved in cell wall biosynthesis